MLDWIKDRALERTSLDGSVLIAAGYGAWTLWKSE